MIVCTTGLARCSTGGIGPENMEVTGAWFHTWLVIKWSISVMVFAHITDIGASDCCAMNIGRFFFSMLFSGSWKSTLLAWRCSHYSWRVGICCSVGASS